MAMVPWHWYRIRPTLKLVPALGSSKPHETQHERSSMSKTFEGTVDNANSRTLAGNSKVAWATLLLEVLETRTILEVLLKQETARSSPAQKNTTTRRCRNNSKYLTIRNQRTDSKSPKNCRYSKALQENHSKRRRPGTSSPARSLPTRDASTKRTSFRNQVEAVVRTLRAAMQPSSSMLLRRKTMKNSKKGSNSPETIPPPATAPLHFHSSS